MIKMTGIEHAVEIEGLFGETFCATCTCGWEAFGSFDEAAVVGDEHVAHPDGPLDARAGYVAGLRELADWTEAHPDLPPPYSITHRPYPVHSAHGQIGFPTLADLERVAAELGVKIADRGPHWSGDLATGRISITLVWFPVPPTLPTDEPGEA